MVKEACGASKATEETGSRSNTWNRKKFNRRRETLLKQANELRILCGCQVAMFYVQPDGGQIEVWDSGEGALHNTLNAYLKDQHSDPNKKKRRKLKNYKEDSQEEEEEPVASAYGCSTEQRSLRPGSAFAEDSWDTSNYSDDDDDNNNNMGTDDSTKVLPLMNSEDHNLVDLELRLGGFNSNLNPAA